MAIGFGYQRIARPLNPQETGVPDYVGSLTKGLEAGYKPSELSEKLLSSMLGNKINETKAKYTERLMQSQIAEHQQNASNKAFEQNLLRDAFKNAGQGIGGFKGGSLNPIYAGILKHKYGIDFNARTPEEKAQADINKAVAIDEAKASRKKSDEIETNASALLDSAKDIETIEDVLYRNPNGTGIIPGLLNKANISNNEDYGTLTSAAQNLQAKMVHQFGKQGGYNLANLVNAGKPAVGNAYSKNLGITKELKEKVRSSFEEMNRDYKRKTGHDLPQKLQDSFMNVENEARKLGHSLADIEHTAKLKRISPAKVIIELRKKGNKNGH